MRKISKKTDAFISGPNLFSKDIPNKDASGIETCSNVKELTGERILTHSIEKRPTRKSSIKKIATDIVFRKRSFSMTDIGRKISCRDKYDPEMHPESDNAVTMKSQPQDEYEMSDCEGSTVSKNVYVSDDSGIESSFFEDDINAQQCVRTNHNPATEKPENNGQRISRRFSFRRHRKAQRRRSASLNREQEIEELLEAENNIDFLYPTGFTLLHQAIMLGDIHSVQLLIQKGAGVECHTLDGVSPILLAAQCGQFQIAQLLIKSGAGVGDIQHGHQSV